MESPVQSPISKPIVKKKRKEESPREASCENTSQDVYSSCTLSKVFWIKTRPSPQCFGHVESLAKFPDTEKELILNQLTPWDVPVTVLVGMACCQGHRYWLGSASPLTKKNTCELLGCSKKAGGRRVTLAVSRAIFHKLGQHVPVGSGLCESHRKQIPPRRQPEIPTRDTTLLTSVEKTKDVETQTDTMLDVKIPRQAAEEAKKKISDNFQCSDSESSLSSLSQSQEQPNCTEGQQTDQNDDPPDHELGSAVLNDVNQYLTHF